MNGVMDKPVVDVYSKYPVTGMNWRLEGKGIWHSESVSLGVYMQYALVKGGGDKVDSIVIDNALYFNGVDEISEELAVTYEGTAVKQSKLIQPPPRIVE